MGALLGAFVGSALGYLFSYRLAKQTREADVEQRRRRLMRALSHEIAVDIPPTIRASDDLNWEMTVTSGVHLATLEPLLGLVADLPDEGLLAALAKLNSEAKAFNDELVSINALWLTSRDRLDLLESALGYIDDQYAEVRKASQTVIELLEVRV